MSFQWFSVLEEKRRGVLLFKKDVLLFGCSAVLLLVSRIQRKTFSEQQNNTCSLFNIRNKRRKRQKEKKMVRFFSEQKNTSRRRRTRTRRKKFLFQKKKEPLFSSSAVLLRLFQEFKEKNQVFKQTNRVISFGLVFWLALLSCSFSE